MKKTLLSACLLWTTAAFILPQAHADLNIPDRTHKWEAGVDLYGHIPSESKVDNAAQVGVHGNYGLFENFAIGVSAGWANPDLSATIGNGTEVPAGSVTVVPLVADFIFRQRPGHYDNLYSFYALVGVGALFTSHEDDDAELTRENLRAEVDDSYAFKLGLGMEYFLTKNWIFFIEGGYVATGADIQYFNRVTGAGVDKKDLDYWYLGGGAKYLFD